MQFFQPHTNARKQQVALIILTLAAWDNLAYTQTWPAKANLIEAYSVNIFRRFNWNELESGAIDFKHNSRNNESKPKYVTALKCMS